MLIGKLLYFSAKKSSSPADIAGKLAEFGFPSSVETHKFAEEIVAKVPRKASGLNVCS